MGEIRVPVAKRAEMFAKRKRSIRLCIYVFNLRRKPARVRRVRKLNTNKFKQKENNGMKAENGANAKARIVN